MLLQINRTFKVGQRLSFIVNDSVRHVRTFGKSSPIDALLSKAKPEDIAGATSEKIDSLISNRFRIYHIFSASEFVNLLNPGIIQKKAARQLTIETLTDLSDEFHKGKLTPAEIRSSDILQNLSSCLEDSLECFSSKEMVHLLSILLRLGLDFASQSVRILEMGLENKLDSLRELQLRQLILCYNSFNKDSLSDEQRKFVQKLKAKLNDQHVNGRTMDLSSLINCIQDSKQYTTSIQPEIERGLIDVLSNPEGEDPEHLFSIVCRLINVLANNRQRPTPILHAATDKLNSLPIPYSYTKDAKLLITTLHSLGTLNYYHILLISKIVNYLVENVNFKELNDKVCTTLLLGMMSTRWRSCDILDWMCRRLVEPNPNPYLLICNLQAHSLLDYKSHHLENFYDRYKDSFLSSLKRISPQKRIEIIWSLVYLSLDKPGIQESVLEKRFLDFMTNSSLPLSHHDCAKLLNIRAIALLEEKVRPTDVTHLDVLVGVKTTKKLSDTNRQLKESLTNLLGTNIESDIRTPFGFQVDFEVWLDDNLKSVPITNSGGLKALNITELAEAKDDGHDFHKVAILCHNYKDFLLSHPSEVLGHKKIVSRILRALGYTTIHFPGSFAGNSDLVKQALKSVVNSNKAG